MTRVVVSAAAKADIAEIIDYLEAEPALPSHYTLQRTSERR
jgi:plasmid stabilization system protein ParE